MAGSHCGLGPPARQPGVHKCQTLHQAVEQATGVGGKKSTTFTGDVEVYLPGALQQPRSSEPHAQYEGRRVDSGPRTPPKMLPEFCKECGNSTSRLQTRRSSARTCWYTLPAALRHQGPGAAQRVVEAPGLRHQIRRCGQEDPKSPTQLVLTQAAGPA